MQQDVKHSAVSKQVVSQLSQPYFSIPAPPSDCPNAQGALGELLHSSSVYSMDRTDSLPYDPTKVSLPARGDSPVKLGDVAQPGHMSLLDGGGASMLREAAEAQVVSTSRCDRFCLVRIRGMVIFFCVCTKRE